MRPKEIVVATHGHCFDGLASATVFTALRKQLGGAEALAFRYRSCGYGPNMSQVPEAWLDGDENAILDFRFTPSQRLDFYFDHHVTGFGSEAEREAALVSAAASLRDATRPKVYYDAAYPSCTKLIADVARAEIGFEPGDLEELVVWADVIDSARFPSPEAAVDKREPIMQLASVVEHHGDGPFLTRTVRALLERPATEVAKSEEIRGLFRPIDKALGAHRARVEKGSRQIGRVVLTDIADAPVEAGGKFVSYALFPRAVYSVALVRTKQHYKMSVGYNPWCGAPREHDISELCRRFGGGGHPAVGAATFPLADIERARAAMREALEVLNQ